MNEKLAIILAFTLLCVLHNSIAQDDNTNNDANNDGSYNSNNIESSTIENNNSDSTTNNDQNTNDDSGSQSNTEIQNDQSNTETQSQSNNENNQTNAETQNNQNDSANQNNDETQTTQTTQTNSNNENSQTNAESQTNFNNENNQTNAETKTTNSDANSQNNDYANSNTNENTSNNDSTTSSDSNITNQASDASNSTDSNDNSESNNATSTDGSSNSSSSETTASSDTSNNTDIANTNSNDNSETIAETTTIQTPSKYITDPDSCPSEVFSNKEDKKTCCKLLNQKRRNFTDCCTYPMLVIWRWQYNSCVKQLNMAGQDLSRCNLLFCCFQLLKIFDSDPVNNGVQSKGLEYSFMLSVGNNTLWESPIRTTTTKCYGDLMQPAPVDKKSTEYANFWDCFEQIPMYLYSIIDCSYDYNYYYCPKGIFKEELQGCDLSKQYVYDCFIHAV